MALNVTDTLDRPLRSLRISVTDRCNFRCAYCMPKEVFGRDYRFLPRRLLLTFEEITRLATIFIARRNLSPAPVDNVNDALDLLKALNQPLSEFDRGRERFRRRCSMRR